MKTASAVLQNYLNATRSGDERFSIANCFTITMPSAAIGASGAAEYFTDWDQNIAWGGNTFLANSVLVQGLKSKVSTGLEVDRQQITIAAWPSATTNGAPLLQAIRDGALDGAWFQRDMVFMSPYLPGGIDGVTMFKGRVSTVDKVGRTSAQITIASPLVVLDYSMPRNLYSPTCLHTLYDAGCGLNAVDFQYNGNVGAGSTSSVILGSGALAAHVQGSFFFATGVNGGVKTTVKSVVPGVSWQLVIPAPETPAPDDAFVVFWGCDHTLGTCSGKFNNGANFRGFPNVPPPEFAI
jgi:uncharacterized phage protein (TIGR02218 family)